MAAKTNQKSRLFNLKEWLSLEDAAKHLSLLFGEEVTVPDVLRLALDHRLTLSAWFVNHAEVRKGKLVPLSECKTRVLPSFRSLASKMPLPAKRVVTHEELEIIYPSIKEHIETGDIILTPDAIHYSDNDEWLVLEDEVTAISGIWDLPMRGGEALDVEHHFQMETGGPAITLTNLAGAFVVRNGIVCQLQESYEENEYMPGSKAHGERVEIHIATKELSKEAGSELRAKYAAQRRKFLEDKKDGRDKSYPSGGLPKDTVYVVRTSALRAFEESVLDRQDGFDRSLGKREETTLLNIVGALLGLLLGKTPAGKPQSVFKDQSAVIDALLASYDGKPGLAKRTLEQKLAEAKRNLSSS